MQNFSTHQKIAIDKESEKEISLAEIFQFIRSGKRWIISSTLVCLVSGIAYAFLAPAKYEASASIEMASVAGKEVESANVLAEKLKLPLYYSHQTYKDCKVEHELPSPGQYLANQLKPMVAKNAPIVTLKFKGPAPTEAQQCLETVVAEIKQKQGVIAKPLLDQKNSQLQTLMQRLDASEKLAANLPVKDMKFIFENSKYSDSALLLATLLTKQNETRELRNQIYEMQLTLTKPQTKDTSLVTPVYAPNIKSEPKGALVILSSAIGGILLGILLWGIKKSRRIQPADSRKNSSPSTN